MQIKSYTPTPTGSSPLEHAIYYHRAGAVPIPLDWPTPEGTSGSGKAEKPRDIGKRPLLGTRYQDTRPDEDQIRRWWRRWPEANVGLLLAPSGLVVLDADCPEAIVAVEALGVAGAVVCATGAGRHYYWRRPEDAPATRAIKIRKGEGWLWGVGEDAPTGHGVDLLADGYAVVGPSIHRTGRRYEPIDFAALVEPPAWVVEELHRANAPTPKEAPAPAPARYEHRGTDLEELESALNALDPDLGLDDWIKTGFAVWQATGGDARGLAIWDAWSARSSAGKYTPAEVRRRWATFGPGPLDQRWIFRQALDAGWTSPLRPHRPAPPRSPRPEPPAPIEPEPEPEPPKPSAPSPRAPWPPIILEHDSHTYLAEQIAPVLAAGGELASDGIVWRYEAPIWREIPEALQRQTVQELDRVDVLIGYTKDGDERLKPFKADRSAINGTIGELGYLRGVWRGEDFFDAAPPGVQFADRFVGLIGGELRVVDPSPEHRQRAALAHPYDPDAPASAWERALSEWLAPTDAQRIAHEDGRGIFFGRDGQPVDPDDDAAARYQFLQEFVGAALLGLAPRYKRAALLLGGGDNGKSVLIETLAALFPEGTVASVPPQKLDQDYQLASLEGARLNAVAELPNTAITTGAAWKSVVAGDKVSARNPYEKVRTFAPTAAHLYGANALPPTRDHSRGFWSRFVLIDFPNLWGKGGLPPDPHLRGRLLAELPGIAAWALRGAARLIAQGGYTAVPSSEALLTRWQRDADPVLRWLDEYTEPDHDGGTAAVTLWREYDRWQQDQRVKARGSRTFYERLKEQLGEPARGRYGRAYPIRVTADPLI